jgi:hypothetical protein
MKMYSRLALGGLLVLAMAGSASAATWTADNVYNLVGQIYVMPGATLTIEAGTQIRSIPADQGSLAVTRGAKIFVKGTATKPVVFTSTNDNGTWREAINEWGNLTVMGNGLISASHFGGQPVGSNTKDPSGLNIKQMEGLTDLVNGKYGGVDPVRREGAGPGQRAERPLVGRHRAQHRYRPRRNHEQCG